MDYECEEQQYLRLAALESVGVLRDGEELCWRLDFGADSLGGAGVLRQDAAQLRVTAGTPPRCYIVWYEWPTEKGYRPGRQSECFDSASAAQGALGALFASLGALLVSD